jgi:hypothetical protein
MLGTFADTSGTSFTMQKPESMAICQVEKIKVLPLLLQMTI